MLLLQYPLKQRNKETATQLVTTKPSLKAVHLALALYRVLRRELQRQLWLALVLIRCLSRERVTVPSSSLWDTA